MNRLSNRPLRGPVRRTASAALLAAVTACALLASGAATAGAGDSAPDPVRQREELQRLQQEVEKAREELARAAAELARAASAAGTPSPRAYAYRFMADRDRAVLGVIIERGDERGGELVGVRVDAVTPGGGAEKAGIEEGDLLVGINGEPLRADLDDRNTPGTRLRRVMETLKPGDRVRLEYERDGRTATANVEATRPESMAYAPGTPAPPAPPHMAPFPPMPPDAPLPPGAPEAAADYAWSLRLEDQPGHDLLMIAPPGPGGPGLGMMMGLQLASLDDDLAGYFRTTGGVLVVRAPKDNSLLLKSGDVIKQVDSKAVTDPREALERLRAAGPSKPVSIEVWRQGRSYTLDAKTPEHTALLDQRIERDVRVVRNGQ